MDEYTYFTEEALKAMDGKKVPLTRELGGPVIGETTLKYDPGVGVIAEMKIDDPNMAEALSLSEGASSVIFHKES
jgi:hypothetical protein